MHPSDPDNDPDIRSRLSAARLPVMPQILAELIEHCQTDAMSMAEVAELIAKDAALTAKVLSAANNSVHHDANHLSLKQAVTALGSGMVRTLLVNESVGQLLAQPSLSGSTDLRRFWKHSFAAAVTARMIAIKMGYPHIEEAYLAGLLHDIGRLALLRVAPAEYAAHFLAEDDEHLCAVEQRLLGITHHEAAAHLIGRWNLDSFLADSVLYHHEPMARLEKAHPLIRIVFLAHQLAADGKNNPPTEAIGSLCGLNAADLELIRGHASEHVKKAAGYLGIELADTDGAPVAARKAPPQLTQDSANAKLSEKVRSLVIASEAGRSFSREDGEAKLLETVTQSARMLFEFDDAIILLLESTGHALVGTSIGEHRRRLAEFSIPLNGGGSIAEAALQRRLTTIGRDGNPLSLAEEQLLGILGTESLVCLPLVADHRCHGVIIGGVSSWQVADFRRREGNLQAFAAQASAAIRTVAAERNEANRELASIEEKYLEASRRVAHEVNNPLAIIKNYLSVLDRKLAKQEPVSGEMSILNEEIDRVGQIVNGLGAAEPVSRKGSSDVNRVVNDVVRLFRDTEYVPPSVQIAARTQDQPFAIDCDAATLKQILVNLIKNAVEALSAGGKISIANNGLVNRDGALYVELSIKDTGPGISPEVMANLFSPVRSTKGDGHRGLGLSIVHGLIKRMNGMITCRSDKKGTTFEILLPDCTDQTPASRSQLRSPA